LSSEGCRRISVALAEGTIADTGELDVGGVDSVREVGVAVAELLREIELEPLGELFGDANSVRILPKAGGRFLRRKERDLLIAAPLSLARFERDFLFHRYEHVLKVDAPRVMRMDVAGSDRADAKLGGEVAQRGAPARVAAAVRTLELDEEAVRPEGAGEPGGCVGIPNGEALAGAPGEADEAFVLLGEERGVEPGIEALLRVRGGEEAAEVGVAPRALHE
jgi:hypothetical protein